MAKKNIIKQYLEAGKNLTLLQGKRPVVDNWTNTIIDADRLYIHNGNIGWVLGKDDLVVDVDPKNGGTESFEQLVKDLQLIDPSIELIPTVVTPSGGYHIYLKKDPSIKTRKILKQYKGIDFLSAGCQCVIVSSSTGDTYYEWADDLLGLFEQLDAPQALLNIIGDNTTQVNKKLDIDSGDSGLGDFTGLVSLSNNAWPQDKVVEMLNNIDPSIPNDEWVKVGMALHDWCQTDGLSLWEKWSQGGDNYVKGETAKRWKSFTTHGGVTLGTISHMATRGAYLKEAEKVANIIAKISIADEETLELHIYPLIKKHSFDKINREKIVKAIQDRLKALSGIRLPINDVRDKISISEVVTGEFVEKEAIPDWCDNWVYVNSYAAFFDLRTLRLHKAEAFNIENGRYIPRSESGSKPSACKYVSDGGFVKKVDATAFLPTHKDTICELENSTVLNTFDINTIPKEAYEISDDGLEAIEYIKRHIKFICTTEQNADIFTQWLAHQVQYPGRQVLWSPVIQSIQGVGKSFFGELLRACLGDRNVGTVSPSQVTSDFNGWATNVVVNVLEELRVKGHNRHDAVNSLKPLITDRLIQINDKGVKPFMTYNTTNYICFTNYKDSLPLDGDDRRWWVIFVPIQSLSEMEKYVGEPADIYFPKLFKAVKMYGDEIRKWLLDYAIKCDFLNTKQAPMTTHKRSMIATEEASYDGLTELKELINGGGKYYNNEVICSADLFEIATIEHPELNFHTSKRHVLLKKLGYSVMPKPINIDGKTRRVWTKREMSNDEIRKILAEKSTSKGNV